MAVLLVVALSIVALQMQPGPPDLLPAAATIKLRDSLKTASAHKRHAWRDTAAFEGEFVNAIIEIPRGERRKFEFDMAKNAPAVDRRGRCGFCAHDARVLSGMRTARRHCVSRHAVK